MNKLKVIILKGPTSSGKTSLALKLCDKFNGEIISADSRQVYQFMDIGTGKVPINSDAKVERGKEKWVINGVNIWGYDLVAPNEKFSAYDFATYALPKAKEILSQGKNVFLVGGTGFYIDIFTGKVKPSNVMPDFEAREGLEEQSLESLQEQLKYLDPETYKIIDLKNKVRLVRAIEKKISKNVNDQVLPYLEETKFLHLGLTAPRELLYQRADKWVDEIWNNGLMDEVERLQEMGYVDLLVMRGIIYRTAFAYAYNKLSKEEAIQRTKFDVHQYIKRQETYFKKNDETTWLDITADDTEKMIYNEIERAL